MGGWKRGKFVFGGYHGNWDVAVVSDTGGETPFLTGHPKDDKPSDWWLPWALAAPGDDMAARGTLPLSRSGQPAVAGERVAYLLSRHKRKGRSGR